MNLNSTVWWTRALTKLTVMPLKTIRYCKKKKWLSQVSFCCNLIINIYFSDKRLLYIFCVCFETRMLPYLGIAWLRMAESSRYLGCFQEKDTHCSSRQNTEVRVFTASSLSMLRLANLCKTKRRLLEGVVDLRGEDNKTAPPPECHTVIIIAARLYHF